MDAILVTHSHWDREWYRTFQDFRARLVDLVDRVIALCEADPGYCFLLDGQTVVLEDYLEIRPGNAERLRALCAAGRVALGPWYVQPDSLLPSGEAHVRNLSIGRRVGEAFGPVSRSGYTPDSFGHPAQLPQILAGFGIGSFVYWRGNGSEIDALPSEYDWEAPDGSRVVACHLGKGYFAAATPPDVDLAPAVAAIAARAKELAAKTRSGAILLLNGIDHAMPEPRTAELARALSSATGFAVRRGLLDDFVARVTDPDAARPRFSGELVGARVAPLLPGVWSTRTWIKQQNRRAEAALLGFAEPFAALARAFGLPDEAPALDVAWKALLANQAHDSICGCSRDEVHEQMRPRFDTARELALQTTKRCVERLAGLGPDRPAPWSDAFDLVVANPSPRPRSGRVRFPLDFHPYLVPAPNPVDGIHPTMLGDLRTMGFTVDGAPARLVPAEPGRLKLVPERGAFDLEFVARDVPALGLRRVRVARAPDGLATRDEEAPVVPGSDDARIGNDRVLASLRADGTVDLRVDGRRFAGLLALESTGDRGDTYDHDDVGDGPGLASGRVTALRRVHPSGVQELRVQRCVRVPARLARSRDERCEERVEIAIETTLRLVPGVPRLDVELRLDNTAEDHRLRLLFPLPEPAAHCDVATTFDVARRVPGATDDTGWVQRAPATFPHQGFVHAGGLSVVAPGLPEAELVGGALPAIAITLLRCVGSLSRPDLASRPGPAGPGTDTPGAQCPGPFAARVSLFAGCDPAAAREAELDLAAFCCGEQPLAPEGVPLVAIDPPELLLSALKPAEDPEAVVLRVLNPTDAPRTARVRLGFPFGDVRAVRLDESDADDPVEREGDALRVPVPAHALRSIRIGISRSTSAGTRAPAQPVGPPVPGWTPREPPRRVSLRGRTCRLDPADPEQHAEPLWEATRGDPGGLFTYLPYGPFATSGDYHRWMVETCRGADPRFFAIVDEATDRPVGLASYLRIAPAAGAIEIGHLQFSPALQRTTAATEAMVLMLRHAFEELRYRRCEWKCDALNARSRRAAERLGFRFEGVFRQATVVKGRSRDTAWFSILDHEWPAHAARLRRWLDPANFDAEGRQRRALGR